MADVNRMELADILRENHVSEYNYDLGLKGERVCKENAYILCFSENKWFVSFTDKIKMGPYDSEEEAQRERKRKIDAYAGNASSIIERVKHKWCVYTCERGRIYVDLLCSEEEEACQFMYEKLKRYFRESTPYEKFIQKIKSRFTKK